MLHSKSDNREIMINGEADEVIRKLFKSLLNRYQIGLEKLIKGSEFVFFLLYYKCHEIDPDRGGSYIYSPNCIKNKKETINPIKKR